jgi:transcriptional regulator with XRE-family HTH domain
MVKYTILNFMSSEKIIILNMFSKRLKELIKSRLKITQKAFADKIGVDEGYLSMVLHGKSGPSADMIAGIFLEYGEHLNWLLTGQWPCAAPEVADERECICSTFSDEIKKACRDVKEILDSDDQVAALALRTNIAAFKDSVERKEEIRKLKEEVKNLKKILQADLKAGTSKAAGTGSQGNQT